MSKFRNLLGGLAAIGLLSALTLGGALALSTTSSHVSGIRADASTATSADTLCMACVGNQ